MIRINIAIVDDHCIIRQGLHSLLKSIPEVSVLFEANNGIEYMELLETCGVPEIVIMDILMPKLDGVETINRASEKYPSIRYLVLTMYENQKMLNKLIQMKIHGVVFKNADFEELKFALKMIQDGGTYFSQKILHGLIDKNNNHQQIDLSWREQEVLQLMSEGYDSYEISKMLNLSVRTVEKYRSHLLEKTQCKNSLKMVIFAIKNGMVEFW